MDDEALEELTRSIAIDDPAESAKKLKAFLNSQRSKSGQAVDQNALAAGVSRVVERKLEWDRAILDLGENYADVLSNPKLAALAGAEANKVLQIEMQNEASGRGRRPFYQILSEGAESIRQWARSSGMRLDGATGDDPPDPGNQPRLDAADDPARLERKQTATSRQPTTRVARVRPSGGGQQEPQPVTDEIGRSRSAIAETSTGLPKKSGTAALSRKTGDQI